MPFGLSSSGSKSSNTKALSFKSIKHNESGRLHMSGIMHDGYMNKSSQSSQRQHHQQSQPRYNGPKLTPTRSRTPSKSGIPQRPQLDNRYHSHQVGQQKHLHRPTQIDQHNPSPNYHNGSIPHAYSNNSHGSLHSGHSKSSASNRHRRTNSSNSSSGHSMSSSSGNGRQRKQHIRVPSGNSDVSSVYSLPTVTSRSTTSEPSGHGRVGPNFLPTGMNQGHNHSRRVYSTIIPHSNVAAEKNLHHQFYNSIEHRDPSGETTNTRRNQQVQSTKNEHQHHSLPNPGFHTPVRQQSSALMVKPTPQKSSSASVTSHQSRGSASYTNGSTVLTPVSTPVRNPEIIPRVCTDKYVVKATRKVIEELSKSADKSYPAGKRIIALTNACAEFDHLDESRHNMELRNGVALVLRNVLAVILSDLEVKDNSSESDYDVDRDYDFDEKSFGGYKTDTVKSREGPQTTATDLKPKIHEDIGESETDHSLQSISQTKAPQDNTLVADDNNDDALRMIATALEMVFRGQSEFVHAAYSQCGGSFMDDEKVEESSTLGLLPLLVKLLNRAEDLYQGHRMKKYNADVTLANTTKSLLYLSRVTKLRTQMAKHSGLLDVLCRVTNDEVYNTNASTSKNKTENSSLQDEARVTRVRIVANLANAEANKVLLLSHRMSVEEGRRGVSLLDALLRVAHMDPLERAREYAGVALMDLASDPANQIPMTKNGRLLGTLVKMILVETNAATQESAITAVQSLAFAKENRIMLVSFKRGIVLQALIEALSNGGKGFNEKSRRRAAGALTNLACDESAEAMGTHEGLLQTLAIVSTKDESPEVQTRAAMALTKLAGSITIRMGKDGFASTTNSSLQDEKGSQLSNGKTDIYATLMDALVVASLSPVSNSVSTVLRVKARDPENRDLMARHPGILDTLVDMCLCDHAENGEENNRFSRSGNSTSHGTKNCQRDNHVERENTSYDVDILKDRENATRALMHLTNEPNNRSIMCTPAVLKALVRGATISDSEIKAYNSHQHHKKYLIDIRDSAVRAIERLATEFSNRRAMAHHDGLLVAIAQATEREAKLEAAFEDDDPCEIADSTISEEDLTKTTIQARKLHQQEKQSTQHAYLAKPLLMSLLVAM